MIAGVQGRLLSASFIRDILPTLTRPHGLPAPHVVRGLADYSRRVDASFGPASSARAITEVALLPLLELLGLNVVQRHDADGVTSLQLRAGDASVIAIAAPWGESLDRLWRSAVVRAIAADARWCLCSNGRTLRLVDSRRTWSRDNLEFDLVLLGRENDAQTLLWTIAHASAFSAQPPFLDAAVASSSQYGIHVCRALGTGVLEALELLFGALARGTRLPTAVLWEQSLTVLYRVLFLLFAEARGLVPLWHPVYRERYSVEAIATALLEGRPYKGLWRTVQAISRIAHSGCSTGELRVTAFNGRLFAPVQAIAFDNTRLSDTVMGRAVVALSSAPTTRPGRARILYRDLDVEQLGAVYERVLEYEPAGSGPGTLTRTREIRKASGTFYTPRPVTTFLVRRTLAPLVEGKSAAGILALRVLDPAMGSGAFLVAACRYLATSVEEALIEEGTWAAHDVTPADRVALRREIASRCLFGVDVNPMAVQLARLSLWLATLASDKPLSFLDHHLVTGHSLIGATPDDINRPSGGRRYRHERLPLFDVGAFPPTLVHAASLLARVSTEPDDSADIVRGKEKKLRELQSGESAIARWTEVLDLWCAGWFWTEGTRPDRGAFFDLVARVLDRPSSLPTHTARRFIEHSRILAAQHRFLHWPLAFPEVFAHSGDGSRAAPGFDAVIGNPPWDMVRGDSSSDEARAVKRLDARHITAFVRESGIYHVETRAHTNLYQLFLERALQLVRPGGRIGFVVPSGLVSDAGAAPLRRHLFDHANVEEVTGLDNRLAIFPVHRSVRFVLLTCTAGHPTSAIRARFGLTSPDQLDSRDPAPLVLSRRLISRLSGDDDLGLPELANAHDLAILEGISARAPRLGARDGWHAQFGRELNATDDRALFVPIRADSRGRPVVEGKQIQPFRVALAASRFEIAPRAEVTLRVARHARLAYRDVASATNRLTLIAALIPARAVTTHTLFCLRTAMSLRHQRVLCVLLNSYVANYLIRMRVNTHVTASLISRLPVPLLSPAQPLFARLDALATSLIGATRPVEAMEEYAESQAISAHLYGLTASDFEHVLSTFPLVQGETKQKALDAFIRLHAPQHTEPPRHRNG